MANPVFPQLGSYVQLPFSSVQHLSQSMVTTSSTFCQGVCDWVSGHSEDLTFRVPVCVLGPVNVATSKFGDLNLGPITDTPLTKETGKKLGALGRVCIGAMGGVAHSAAGTIGSIGRALGGKSAVGVVGASMEGTQTITNTALNGAAEVGHYYVRLFRGEGKNVDEEGKVVDGEIVGDEKLGGWQLDGIFTSIEKLGGVRYGPVPRFLGLSNGLDERVLYPYGIDPETMGNPSPVSSPSPADSMTVSNPGSVERRPTALQLLGFHLESGFESARAAVNGITFRSEAACMGFQKSYEDTKARIYYIPFETFLDAWVLLAVDLGRVMVGTVGGTVHASLGIVSGVGRALQRHEDDPTSDRHDGIVAASLHGAHDVVNAVLYGVGAAGQCLSDRTGNVGVSFYRSIFGPSERAIQAVPLVGRPLAFVSVGGVRRVMEAPISACTWAASVPFRVVVALGGVSPAPRSKRGSMCSTDSSPAK